MSVRRMRFAVAALVLAGSCARHEPEPVAPSSLAGAVCRVGPDGGPLVADRGIGGTGAPTGMPEAVVDRGIGGTGIIGVVTGFGSVCVGGEEVALPGSVPVTVDEASADPSVLRAGQLVALEAGSTAGGLSARSVRVRHEVSGPVEAVMPGRLRVAGQNVRVTDTTWRARPFTVGDWVAVSGLRSLDGTIEATRLDPRAPGPVLVHGTLVRDGARLRIGNLPVAAGPLAAGLVGQDVTATGILLGAELQVSSLEPDRLLADPGGFFGAGVGVLLVEGFVAVEGGTVRIGRTALPAGARFVGRGLQGRAVISFGRTDAGRFEAVSVRPAGRDGGPGDPGRAFTPAPGAERGAGNAFGPDRAGAGRGAGTDGRDPGGVRGRSGPGDARTGPFNPDGPGGGVRRGPGR